MKSTTKWGCKPSTRVHICPVCKYLFVNRIKKRCPKCKIALYAGSEFLFDHKGFWWHPKRQTWIPVLQLIEKVK